MVPDGSHFHIDLSMDESPRTPFSTEEQRHTFLRTNETVCNQLFGDRQTDRQMTESHIEVGPPPKNKS